MLCTVNMMDSMFWISYTKKKIDLIILDIMLPYRSGDIILADIRRQFTIPVLIISAKETTQNKIDLLRLGADDYITKTF